MEDFRVVFLKILKVNTYKLGWKLGIYNIY